MADPMGTFNPDPTNLNRIVVPFTGTYFFHHNIILDLMLEYCISPPGANYVDKYTQLSYSDLPGIEAAEAQLAYYEPHTYATHSLVPGVFLNPTHRLSCL